MCRIDLADGIWARNGRSNRSNNVGKQTIAVEVTSVVRASSDSFQVRWIERRYDQGALTSTDRWTGILAIVLQPPTTEEGLRKNPSAST